MPFTATHFLSSVVPADATNASCLDGLAIADTSRWLRVASGLGSRPFSERRMQLIPCSIQAPLPPIMEDRLPGRQIAWQQAPGTSAPNNVEDRIQNLASAVSPRSPATLTFGQVWLDHQPFRVREISVIALLLHTQQRTTVFLRQFLGGFPGPWLQPGA